jgi:hypothetical protein
MYMHLCYHLNLTKFCPWKTPDSSVLASLLNNLLRKCRLPIMTKSVWGCDKEKIAAYIERAFKQCHNKLGSLEVPPGFKVEHFRSNLDACCRRSCEHPVYLRRHKICLDWYGVHGKLKCKHIPRLFLRSILMSRKPCRSRQLQTKSCQIWTDYLRPLALSEGINIRLCDNKDVSCSLVHIHITSSIS